MEDRRYNEEEIRQIMELATSRALARAGRRPEEGLTLSDLQSIGSEVGVDPIAIARAAAALDAGLARPPRRSLGIPIEVGRVVSLPRAPTDEEWDQLVAELRSTFGSPGRVTVQGGLREWRTGNLHASVEPGPTGYRLRLGTIKGDARGLTALGATGLVAGVAVAVSMLLQGEGQAAMVVSAVFGTAGVSALLTNVFRLPRWAHQRASQMEHVADRAFAIISQSHTKQSGPLE